MDNYSWAHHSAFLVIREERSSQGIVYPVWQVGRWVTLPRAPSFSRACWRGPGNSVACLGWVNEFVQPPHRFQSQVSWCSAQQIAFHSSVQARMDSPIPLLSVLCIYLGFQSAIMCGNTQLALIRLSAEVKVNHLRNAHKLYLFTSLTLKTSFQVGERYTAFFLCCSSLCRTITCLFN